MSPDIVSRISMAFWSSSFLYRATMLDSGRVSRIKILRMIQLLNFMSLTIKDFIDQNKLISQSKSHKADNRVYWTLHLYLASTYKLSHWINVLFPFRSFSKIEHNYLRVIAVVVTNRNSLYEKLIYISWCYNACSHIDWDRAVRPV